MAFIDVELVLRVELVGEQGGVDELGEHGVLTLRLSGCGHREDPVGVVVAKDTLPSCAPPLVLDRLGSPLPYEHEATNRVAATAAVTTSSLFRGFFMSSLSLRCLVG